MMTTTLRHVSFAATCAAVLCVSSALIPSVVSAAPAPPAKVPDFSKLPEEIVKKWGGAEVLLVGKMTNVLAGPVGLSDPPYRTYRITIEHKSALRGSGRIEQSAVVNYAIRQSKEPQFPGPDQECVLALKLMAKSWMLTAYEVAKPEVLDQIKAAVSFPLGWTVKEGKLVSPWSAVGKPGKGEGAACSVTGRPVLLAGEGIHLTIQPVPPAKEVKFSNPDGDGEYKLTVKNTGDKEVYVPALLTDGKSIQWKESIVIRCQEKAYPYPGSTGAVSALKPVVLKPGESVDGVLNIFAIDGPQWPMGGYRIEMQFCLGEASATASFYYMSRHHDPIRAGILKGIKK